jgi:hypothetical protein
VVCQTGLRIFSSWGSRSRYICECGSRHPPQVVGLYQSHILQPWPRSSAPNHDPAMIDMALTHACWPLPLRPPSASSTVAYLQAMLLGPTFCGRAKGFLSMPPSGLAGQPPACSLGRLQDARSQGCTEVRNQHRASQGGLGGALKHRMVAN